MKIGQKTESIERLNKLIRNIPDFPKSGIMFKDITPLLADPVALLETTYWLADPFQNAGIEVVAGLESRGFLFGTNLAASLNAGFVPIRKPGKLPAKTFSAEYELEYGADRIEMHTDAISPGTRVLIHDDIIATGGTAEAAARLVRQAGGIVAGYSFILELSFLNGRTKLAGGNIESLIIV